MDNGVGQIMMISPHTDMTGMAGGDNVPQALRAVAAKGTTAQAGGRDLVHAAQEFEAYFISYLMKTMRDTIPAGLIPNKGGKVFESFYDEEIGRLGAIQGSLGYAKMIAAHYQQFEPNKTPAAPLSFGGEAPIHTLRK